MSVMGDSDRNIHFEQIKAPDLLVLDPLATVILLSEITY